MKILIVVTSMRMGGAEKLLAETIPKYGEAGFEITLLVLHHLETELLSELRRKNCCKIILSTSRSVYCPKNIGFIAKHLEAGQLVHVHLFPASFLTVSAAKMAKYSGPIIFTEHNTSNRRFRSELFAKINQIFYKRFTKVVCITAEIKEIVKKKVGLPESKLVVIENGVDLKKIQSAAPYQKKELSRKISDSDFLLVQVSSFREQKDHKTLISSLHFLPEEIKLILVGDGPLKADCELFARNENLSQRVFFLGNRNDVARILKTSDIAVLSSFHEGLSLSSVEGMASGKPFIGSDVPGLSEIVKNYGVLFPQGNSQQLAEKIEKLRNDKSYSGEVVEKCLARASQFDLSTMIDKHIDLYRSLIRKTS